MGMSSAVGATLFASKLGILSNQFAKIVVWLKLLGSCGDSITSHHHINENENKYNAIFNFWNVYNTQEQSKNLADI